MCHPSVGTSHFLKRNGFPASPADYRRSPGAENRPTIGLRDFGSVARVRDALRAATWRTGKLELWDPRGAARGGSTPARRRTAAELHAGGGATRRLAACFEPDNSNAGASPGRAVAHADDAQRLDNGGRRASASNGWPAFRWH